MTKVLLVEDDLGFAETVQAFLRLREHEVMHATDAEEAFMLMDEFPFDVVISDYDLGAGQPHGLEILKAAQERGLTTVLWSGLSRTEEIEAYQWEPDEAVLKSDIESIEELLKYGSRTP